MATSNSKAVLEQNDRARKNHANCIHIKGNPFLFDGVANDLRCANSLPILVRYTKTAPSDKQSETGLVGESNDVSAMSLLAPVRYLDRFALGPRDTTWKLDNGRFIAKMYLVGKDPLTKVSSGRLTLSDGKTSIPVQLSNVQKRGENAALFEVSCNETDGKKLDSGDSWRIALVCGKHGGSSSVRVDVSNSK